MPTKIPWVQNFVRSVRSNGKKYSYQAEAKWYFIMYVVVEFLIVHQIFLQYDWLTTWSYFVLNR